MTEFDAETVAREQSKQGSFSFLERLAGRNLAEAEVDVYLDEKIGYRLDRLTEALAVQPNGEKLIAVEGEIERLKEAAKDSHYVIHMTGISIEDHDALVDTLNEQFPEEYEESRHPLTFELERFPKPNEEREQYWRTHIWAKHIVSVVAPDGSIDDNITPEWVAVFLTHAPMAAVGRVQKEAERLQMATNWMDRIQGDDFLVKS